jgi:hypothetical protein
MISQMSVSRNKNFFFFGIEMHDFKGTNWNTNKFHNNSNYITKSIMLTDSLMIHLKVVGVIIEKMSVDYCLLDTHTLLLLLWLSYL